MSKYDVSKFRNVTVALNTPFKKDGSVDIDAIKAVCRYFRDKGIKQMYVCGSTGEGFLLDTEERMLVAETVVNEVGKDMNIIVHVGCPDTSTGPRSQKQQTFRSLFITFLNSPDLIFL